MNPTKTIYMVYYQATGGSNYRRTDRAITRRGLSIPSDRTYITVEPDQTAKSYAAGVRQKYVLKDGWKGRKRTAFPNGYSEKLNKAEFRLTSFESYYEYLPYTLTLRMLYLSLFHVDTPTFLLFPQCCFQLQFAILNHMF